MFGSLGEFRHTFELMEYQGTLEYTPGSNQVTGSIDLAQSGATASRLAGPVLFTKSPAAPLEVLVLEPGTWTDHASRSFVYLDDFIYWDPDYPITCFGFVEFEGGDPTTPVRAGSVSLRTDQARFEAPAHLDNLTFLGGILSGPGAVRVDELLDFDQGTLGPGGNVEVRGSFAVRPNRTLQITGRTLVLAASSTAVFDGENDRNFESTAGGGRIVNAGSLTKTDFGLLTINGLTPSPTHRKNRPQMAPIAQSRCSSVPSVPSVPSVARSPLQKRNRETS